MSDTHELKGLRGENPLGFLAALGLLRTLDECGEALQPRLHWRWEGGWMPILTLARSLERPALIALLHQHLAAAGTLAVYGLEKDLKLPPGTARLFAADSATEPRNLAMLAAFGLDTGHPDSDHTFLRSPLVNLNGGGQQSFLPTCKTLIRSVSVVELDQALFEPWAYQDPGKGRILHWDPDNEREHALQWETPDSDNNRTVAGAERLGIEALPFFPSAPCLPSQGVPVSMSYRDPRFLSAPCFCTEGTRRATRVYFFWPLWDAALSPAAMQSLLWSLDGARVRSGIPKGELATRGIAIVFAAERVMKRRGASLNPAQPWWIAGT